MKTELIKDIFLDAYLGKENKERDYKYWVKPLNPDDGIKFFCVFRIRLKGKAAILVRIQVDLEAELANTETSLVYIDQGFKPNTRFRTDFTKTFYKKRERLTGLGIDEIIKRVAPGLAEKLHKAEELANVDQ